MATRSLSQVRRQIEKLQKEADAIREKEVAGVVARIQEAIDHYGLTPADLFGPGRRRGDRRGAANAAVKPAAKVVRRTKNDGVIKYRDSEGRSWTGRGRAPQWFKDALASGRTKESLAV